MAKRRPKGKRNYCVSAAAPGYGMRVQRCFKKKANAQKLCKALKSRGNKCKVIGKAKRRHCIKWSSK